jgi:hypothetical protein
VPSVSRGRDEVDGVMEMMDLRDVTRTGWYGSTFVIMVARGPEGSMSDIIATSRATRRVWSCVF